MGDIGDVVCAFCGSIMGLSRETAASADTHALRFFTCGTCGASELRIDRSETRPTATPGRGEGPVHGR
jgi:hypothetical protein